MRVVVTGLIATYPIGGVAWDYLAYVDGFRRLGCEVLYLEDTGQWVYDPTEQTYTADLSANVRYLTAALGVIGAAADTFSVRGPDGRSYGRSAAQVREFCCSADLFLNVSGACWLRDEYRGARRTVYLDTDPGYTQSKLLAYEQGYADQDQLFSVDLIRSHDRFFTFAENIGAADCGIPACGLDWKTTRQPIVIERWPFCFDERARAFTTVMSWKTDVTLPLIDGVRYGGKNLEMERFLDLPRRSPVPLEIAVSGAPPVGDLRARGWFVTDAQACSATMESYRSYVQASRGEWSVAKNVYAALRSGWFSCRTAVYLATGKPAVVQDTGWSNYYPCGEGLFAFSDQSGAVDALQAVQSDYRRHCEAARAITERDLEAGRVLRKLVEDAGL